MVVINRHLITFQLHSWVNWVTPDLLTRKTWGKQNSSWKSVKSVCLVFLSTQDLLVILCASPNFPMVFLLQNFFIEIFFSFNIFPTKTSDEI